MKKYLAVLFAAVLSSCATIAPPAPKGSVDHVVMMWQKKPGNLEDRKKITDAIARLKSREAVYAFQYEGKRYDCGSKEGFLEATVELALEHPQVGESFRKYLKTLSL